MATGYAVQTVRSLRSEETAGRLEPRLSGTLSRTCWIAAHGLVTIVAASAVVLAASTASSMGTPPHLARVFGAGAAYLPAELLVGGLTLALFGLWHRAFLAGWAVFAAVAPDSSHPRASEGLRWVSSPWTLITHRRSSS
jgi:ABC-2 type transport system permease protein